jgi:hypothetical protein
MPWPLRTTTSAAAPLGGTPGGEAPSVTR